MTAQPPQHQVSPESTGGAGTIEESSLGAVALARLLTGDLLPGLTAPTSVALQRRIAGNTLDDLVLRAGTDTGERGIDFQIKRAASTIPSDPAFVETLGQCLETMRQQSEALATGRLQLGFGAAGPRGPLEQLQRLTPGSPEAHSVFSELRTPAETWGPNAGVIDTPMLRAALNARGIPLTADPRRQEELGRVLDAHPERGGDTGSA